MNVHEWVSEGYRYIGAANIILIGFGILNLYLIHTMMDLKRNYFPDHKRKKIMTGAKIKKLIQTFMETISYEETEDGFVVKFPGTFHGVPMNFHVYTTENSDSCIVTDDGKLMSKFNTRISVNKNTLDRVQNRFQLELLKGKVSKVVKRDDVEETLWEFYNAFQMLEFAYTKC
jgi:hypothetical protein